MRQVNFTLIFGFGLAMVFFTLENTTATTVKVIPGVQYTMPLAALLLVVTGIGAVIAWLFAAWSGMLKQVDSMNSEQESEAQEVRIQELETDLNRYRATVETQLGLLPASSSSNTDDDDVHESTHAQDQSSDKTMSIDSIDS